VLFWGAVFSNLRFFCKTLVVFAPAHLATLVETVQPKQMEKSSWSNARQIRLVDIKVLPLMKASHKPDE